jgi:(p)ppGpp synthase/HD superfamily hydrolase
VIRVSAGLQVQAARAQIWAAVRTISCVNGGSVEDAIALALQAHRGETYAATDQPFILHPLRVMLRFESPLLQIVAVLHDVVEDTDVSLESLSQAGFRAEAVSAVDALTRRPGEPYDLYIERVAQNQIASRVKRADLAENLANNQRDPAAPGNADRIRRYRAALLRLEVDTGTIGEH